MIGDLCGRIPKLSAQLARTLVNEALSKIYSESDWSFNYVESGWMTQGVVTQGSITAALGSNQITGDVSATAAWDQVGLSITEMQIRSPAYALYSVIAYQNPIITIDRPWAEPEGIGLNYLMYQAYYPAPVPDLKRWLTIRDTSNASNLDFDNVNQNDLAVGDPQRTIFGLPNKVVPYKTDTRAGSATYGYMLYELYPHALQELPYATFAIRFGPPLVNPGDTLNYPLTEDCVKARARALAYEWKESQKGTETHRGSESNYEFLMQAAEVLYKERIQDIRKIDRNLADPFIRKIQRCGGGCCGGPFFSPITGTLRV
jgi:hypothetical protein